MKNKEKIYVAGHNGMIGSAIIKNLKKNKKYKLIYQTKNKLNLTNQKDVFNFLLLPSNCRE